MALLPPSRGSLSLILSATSEICCVTIWHSPFLLLASPSCGSPSASTGPWLNLMCFQAHALAVGYTVWLLLDASVSSRPSTGISRGSIPQPLVHFQASQAICTGAASLVDPCARTLHGQLASKARSRLAQHQGWIRRQSRRKRLQSRTTGQARDSSSFLIL